MEYQEILTHKASDGISFSQSWAQLIYFLNKVDGLKAYRVVHQICFHRRALLMVFKFKTHLIACYLIIYQLINII